MKIKSISWRRILIGVYLFSFLSSFIAPVIIIDEGLLHKDILLLYMVPVYLMSWSLIAELLYMSAAQLYDLKKKAIGSLLIGALVTEESVSGKRKWQWRVASVPLCLLSYAFTIYSFAVAYLYLSRTDHSAFNVKEMDLFTAIYFSTVTAATVGFGDIFPVSRSARLLVIIEIWLSLIYVIFFFSVLSTVLRKES